MTDANEPGYRGQERQQRRRLHEQRRAQKRAEKEDKRAVEENKQLRLKLFGEYRNEQLTRERANAEKYDTTILTYSTGALGLSLTFIKDVVPLSTAHWVLALYGSWLFFVTALLLMLVSFHVAQAENRESVEFAYKYYVEGDEEYYDKASRLKVALKRLNRCAGGVFFFAIVLTALFVSINVHGNFTMNDKAGNKTTSTITTTTTLTTTYAMDGTRSAKPMPVPTTNLQAGTPAAKMLAATIPAKPATAPPSAHASTVSAPPPNSGKK